MAASQKRNVANAVAGGALAFGAAGLVAPKALIGAYGLPDTAPFRFMTRLWGCRTAAIGVLALTAAEDDRRSVYITAALMNLVDAGVAANAGPDVTRRTRVLVAATSGAFALAAGALAAGLVP